MNFPITKVLVGDGTNTGTTKDTMIVGDLLLLSAGTTSTGVAPHTVLTEAQSAALSANDGVIVVAKTSEGIIESPILRRRDIKSSAYKAYTAPVQKVVTVALLNPYVAGTAYTLGLSIKSDQREFWNKNPEFLATFTPTVDGAIGSATAEEAAAAFALQFTRNMFTSTGSGSQLVKVERTLTGGTITEVGSDGVDTFTVTQGSRIVTSSAVQTMTAGDVINLNGVAYLIAESTVASLTFKLDTAYQGATATYTSGDGGGAEVGTVATPTNWNLRFTGIAQPIKKWDWYSIVDFDIFKKSGFTATTTITVTTALVVGSGTYHQVRDLERKNYGYVRVNTNFTEHPADEYVGNATSGVLYDLVVLEAGTSGWGDWMQSHGRVFGVTLIIAAPLVAAQQFAHATSNSFAGCLTAWIGASTSATAPFT